MQKEHGEGNASRGRDHDIINFVIIKSIYANDKYYMSAYEFSGERERKTLPVRRFARLNRAENGEREAGKRRNLDWSADGVGRGSAGGECSLCVSVHCPREEEKLFRAHFAAESQP